MKSFREILEKIDPEKLVILVDAFGKRGLAELLNEIPTEDLFRKLDKLEVEDLEKLTLEEIQKELF